MVEWKAGLEAETMAVWMDVHWAEVKAVRWEHSRVVPSADLMADLMVETMAV